MVNDTALYWESLSNPAPESSATATRVPTRAPTPSTSAPSSSSGTSASPQLYSNTSYYNRDQHATSDYTQYLRATWTSIPVRTSIPTATMPNTYPQPGDSGYAPFSDNQRNFYEESASPRPTPTRASSGPSASSTLI